MPLVAPETVLVTSETMLVTPETGPDCGAVAVPADPLPPPAPLVCPLEPVALAPLAAEAEADAGGAEGGSAGAAPDEDRPPEAVPVTGAVAGPSALVTAPTTDPAEPVTESAETGDVSRPGAGRSPMVAA
jgi:hypothetical protein